MFITSNNYADFADLIYSQTIHSDEYRLIENKKTVVINETKNALFEATTYKLIEFEIENNTIIYCDTDQLNNLFSLLRKKDTINNIILISSQSDTPITESLYLKKPLSIKKWYSSNVNCPKEDLIPIPLGISNKFSKKNLTETNLENIPNKFFIEDREIKMYVNFNENTNYKERSKLLKLFSKEDWCKVRNSNLDNATYLDDIKRYSFVLCPWGNGTETHRLWETLYLGSIPITKKHPTYDKCHDLPILFVDSYDDINLELLKNFHKDFENFNFDLSKLSIDYWLNDIQNNSKANDYSNENGIVIKESKISLLFYKNKFRLTRNINSRYKKIRYYVRKLGKLYFKFAKKQD